MDAEKRTVQSSKRLPSGVSTSGSGASQKELEELTAAEGRVLGGGPAFGL